MCNKVRYVTKKEALSKLNFLRKSRNVKIKPTRAYHCGVCNQWHLTHQNKHIQNVEIQ